MHLLNSHPYISQFCSSDFNPITSSRLELDRGLDLWKEEVQQMLNSSSPLLNRIPQLVTVCGLLTCDLQLVEAVLGEDFEWPQLTLVLLLFQCAPPLSRAALGRVIEEAISRTGSDNKGGSGNIITIRNLISGNVGPLLRSLYELNKGVLSLLVTSYLSLMVSRHSLGRHLSLQPFLEMLFTELAMALQRLQMPPEVVAAHLTGEEVWSLSEEVGRSLAASLTIRHPLAATTDLQVLETCDRLRDLGDAGGAASCLLSRGRWWMGRGRLSKAAFFFSRDPAGAGRGRLHMLVLRCLREEVQAVTRCQTLFTDMSPRLGPQETAHPQQGGVGRSEEEQLLYAVEQSEEVLQCLLSPEDEEVSPAGGRVQVLEQIFHNFGRSLSAYTAAIRCRLSLSSSSSVADSSRLLHNACRLITGVLLPSPGVPRPFWLHCLELLVWLANAYHSLLRPGDESPELPVSKEEAMKLLSLLEECLGDGLLLQDIVEEVNRLRVGLLTLMTKGILKSNEALRKVEVRTIEGDKSFDFTTRLRQIKSGGNRSNSSSYEYLTGTIF